VREALSASGEGSIFLYPHDEERIPKVKITNKKNHFLPLYSCLNSHSIPYKRIILIKVRDGKMQWREILYLSSSSIVIEIVFV
jgi:uncharacterized protein (UPF0248 family)